MSLSIAIVQPMDHTRPPQDGPISPKGMVKGLKKELNLTEDQAAKIQKIFEAQREEMRKIFDAAEEEREAVH